MPSPALAAHPVLVSTLPSIRTASAAHRGGEDKRQPGKYRRVHQRRFSGGTTNTRQKSAAAGNGGGLGVCVLRVCAVCVRATYAPSSLENTPPTQRHRGQNTGSKATPALLKRYFLERKKTGAGMLVSYIRVYFYFFHVARPVARIGVDVIKRGRDGNGEHLRVHKMLCTTLNAALSTGASKMNQK